MASWGGTQRGGRFSKPGPSQKFVYAVKSKAETTPKVQPTETKEPTVEGLRYERDVLNEEEETNITKYLETQGFFKDNTSSYRTQVYILKDLKEEGDEEAKHQFSFEDISPDLKSIITRMIDRGFIPSSKAPNEMRVYKIPEGEGGAFNDSEKGLQYEEPTILITLNSPHQILFKNMKTSEQIPIYLERRSACVLTKDAFTLYSRTIKQKPADKVGDKLVPRGTIISIVLRRVKNEVVEEKRKMKEKKRMKRPNFFLALKIEDDRIVEQVKKIQQRVVQTSELFEKRTILANKLHVTLFVFHVPNDKVLEKAKQILQNCSNILHQHFAAEPKVRLKGLDTFNDRILWIHLEDSPEKQKLIQCVKEMKEYFVKNIPEISFEDKEFQPHVTILKLKKRDNISIPKDAYAPYVSKNFGLQSLKAIELLEMTEVDENGYYKCHSSLNIAQPPAVLPSQPVKVQPTKRDLSGTIKNKLKALRFKQCETFDTSNERHVKDLVEWLEDISLRLYKIEDRKFLRKYDENWKSTFEKYLIDSECPKDILSSVNEGYALSINWLLNRAISYAYSDNKAEYNRVTSLPAIDRTNYESKEFNNAVRELAATLNIPTNADTDRVVRAICTTIATTFPRIMRGDLKDERELAKEQELPLGFECGDAAVDRAATVLRMLYINDLRGLQSDVNSLISQLQTYTANPKTDASLAHVGR